MATLSDRQFEMDGYLFGRHAPTGVEVTDVDFGSPEARSTDVDRPRADGTRFGREWRAGREITLEVADASHRCRPGGTRQAVCRLGRRRDPDGSRHTVCPSLQRK